jgi:formylglycine-generating enzyme required for sulfatase activity
MVLIPAGEYVPFLKAASLPQTAPSPAQSAPSSDQRPRVHVEGFWLDVRPVTNREFAAFVAQNPRWSRSQVSRLFADDGYLSGWRSDRDPGSDAGPEAPVTRVSWFAAGAYCEWKGKSLPTVDQWEYAADDRGRSAAQARKAVLDWYTHPTPERLPSVRSAARNGFGVAGLHGMVWEWVLDFNGAMTGSESRDDSSNSGLFCGAGGASALDPSDYAAFMRYAFRNSLKASYTVSNLGFRCAQGVRP